MDPAFAVVLIILGLILAISGLIGCILPIIPGPPLSYIALILLSLAKNWEPFSAAFLIVMGVIALVVLILDYVVPLIGAKKYGATRLGLWGSIIGMVVGIFFFPPFGIFIGGFAGAMAGELFAGKAGNEALRAGIGVFIGNLVSIGLKMGLSGVILFFYVKEML
ncbi:MAG: DUF456 domain-containing protein [Deltaproteobacteria bacterium]|nr:DUF456 domain-containing protein [Deltaproteobacteria bacterium]MBW2053508.1 DUF456 domain-containing protein [Deltaproteobacteria bacterium]MBW2142325.1 DUF456 domain-containing protein [Deltaproteobacteria bacterium]MBW2324721.1 DUF456 domain-containing protein [Deltaproteobacteria bacterium]